MEDKKPSLEPTSAMQGLVELTQSYIEEAKYAKQNRMDLNRRNFDAYHCRQDWSHKTKGQSQEFLAKQPMAVEQISTFMQMGLVDSSDWFGVEKNTGVDEVPITPEEVRLLISWALDKCEFLPFVGDQVKMGLLQALAISKVHGEYKQKPVFYTEVKEEDGSFKDKLMKKDRTIWVPKIESLRAEDFYPDPSGRGLYFIEEFYLDLSDCYRLAEGPHKIYDLEKVKTLSGSYSDSDMQAARKARETGQNTALSNYRKKVKINQCWGSIIDPVTGQMIKEKQMWTIADSRVVIQEPKDYPFWHGGIPIISSPFIRVPHSVWHKALMDAPTQTNIALNELYNLMVDGGMVSAHGIKQIRTDWLADESQVSNGIYPGITLKVNGNCPPMAKALETVSTGSLQPETFNVFQAMSAEFSASSLTNDLRMGVLPNRAVKATEVVEASQSITSVFTGLAKVIEVTFIEPILMMTWKNCLQHFDELDAAEIKDVLSPQRYEAISKLSKEELFAKCCDGYKFKVYGISRILSKQKDFRKLTGLLQTIAGAPILAEEFQKKYSMSKFLGQIIESLDINTSRLEISQEEQAAIMAAQQSQQGAAPQQGGPNMQSQIPQANAQEGADTVESMIPRGNFGSLQGKANGGMR